MALVKNSSHDLPNDQTFPLPKAFVSSVGSQRRVQDCHISGFLLSDRGELAGQAGLELWTTPERGGAVLGQHAVAVLIDWGGARDRDENKPVDHVNDGVELVTGDTSRSDADVGERGQQGAYSILDQHVPSLGAGGGTTTLRPHSIAAVCEGSLSAVVDPSGTALYAATNAVAGDGWRLFSVQSFRNTISSWKVTTW